MTGPIDLREEQSRLVTVSLIVIATVAGAFALAYTRAVMVPLVLAVFLFYLVTPLTDFLEVRLRLPRPIAVLITLVLGSVLIAVLGLLITASVRGLLGSADIYRERLAYLTRQAVAVLDRRGLDLGQDALVDTVRQLPLGRLIQSTAGTMIEVVSKGVLVLIFLIFLMVGRRRGLVKPPLFQEIDAKFRRYLSLKFAISAATGLVVGIILTAIGLDLALVFGVLTFLLNFIPSVGSIVATLLPIPVALVQFDSAPPVILVVLLPGMVQIVIGNFLDPILMGEGLELSPVTVLAALIFWGLIWGIVGMLLAAPMTALARIALARFETTRPVAEILAGRLPGARFRTGSHPVAGGP